MRWSLQRQIFIPFSLLLVGAVAITAFASAWDAARRSNVANAEQLKRLIETLRGGNYPYTEMVLQQVKGLSGAELAIRSADDAIGPSTFALEGATLPAADRMPSIESTTRITDFPTFEQNGRRFFAASFSTTKTGEPATVWVFYPEERWLQSRWDAVWPPLLVGGLSSVLALVLSGLLAHRFASRIGRIRSQLNKLAAQQYEQMEVDPPDDELSELQSSTNQLARRLQALQDEIVHTERVRLLAQIAGGLAHQLRNAVTGARMGVELHQRRCTNGDTQSLNVALSQLTLTEEQIKGLLALGARRPQELRGGDLRQIVASIGALVEPMCRHVQVTFESNIALDNADTYVHDADSMRAALLNLVLNAVEAAGQGGEVTLAVKREGAEIVASVVDTGPGPPAATANSLFEPFVTSKPEGVGLGLTLAQHTALNYDGVLQWRRLDGRTIFEMRWPISRVGEKGMESTEQRSAALMAAVKEAGATER